MKGGKGEEERGEGRGRKGGRGTVQPHWFLASAKLLHLSHKLWQILKQCAHQPGLLASHSQGHGYSHAMPRDGCAHSKS